MNDIFFYSILSGINIVFGVFMFFVLASPKVTQEWSAISKVGFFLMACGLIGQAITVLMQSTIQSPLWEQFWVLKDFGILIFSLPIINKWVDSL